MLAEGGVAAFGLTVWFVAGLERNSLESNVVITSLFINHKQYLLTEEMETVAKNRSESKRGLECDKHILEGQVQLIVRLYMQIALLYISNRPLIVILCN